MLIIAFEEKYAMTCRHALYFGTIFAFLARNLHQLCPAVILQSALKMIFFSPKGKIHLNFFILIFI